MKKVISVMAIIAMMFTGLFAFAGCGKNNDGSKEAEKKADNTIAVSYVNGKGTFTVNVPKKDDGTAKYQFTTEKPEGLKFRGTFYLETDKAVICLSSSGLAYNTSKDYKAKHGETKATFDGYLEFMNEPEQKTLRNNAETLEINGRKAVKRPSREGSSNDYKYYGYNYMIAADDVYPGSYIGLSVYYKGDEVHTSADPIDDETQAIIDSLKVTVNS